jgi:hypothetical protein
MAQTSKQLRRAGSLLGSCRGELSATNASTNASLIDPEVLLATCGGNNQMLEEMCHDFKTYSPVRTFELTAALDERNGPRLREAAHKFCGLLSAFSSTADRIASTLEVVVARADQIDEARPLVDQLETMTGELAGELNGLTVASLRRQLAAINDSTMQVVRSPDGKFVTTSSSPMGSRW